jgi:hypothetical protein
MGASSMVMQYRETTDGTGNAWRDGSLSQPSLLNVRQRIRQRFTSVGFEESIVVDNGPSPDMLFQSGDTSIRVVILDEPGWANRQAFLNSIMKATALAGKSNKTYLALPKSAASLTDARLFHERGIGLFTYDHRNVDEALPARHFEMATGAVRQTREGIDHRLENEIRELRAQIDTLERTVHSLSEELMSLRRVPSAPEPVDVFPSTPTLTTIDAVESLPTFFAGNPWLEVLSRRGREDPRIAR